MEHQLSDFSRHSENMRKRGSEEHQLGSKFLWKTAELLCTIQCLSLRDKRNDGKGGDTGQVVPEDPCADLWVLFAILCRLAVWQWLWKPYFPYLSNAKIGQQQSYPDSKLGSVEGQKKFAVKVKVSSSAILLKLQCSCPGVKCTPGWGDLGHHLVVHIGHFMPIWMERAWCVIYTICSQLSCCCESPEIKPVLLG